MLHSSSLYVIPALAAALFCRMLGVFIILPVAVELVLARPDGSHLAAGIVLGGYGLTQAMMQIPIGRLADRVGKKPVILLALALFAGGGFYAAAADSITHIIIGRLLQGMGAVAAVSAAWIADIAAPERRTVAMAAFGAVIGLAFMVSLFTAPAAADSLGLAGMFNLTGWLGIISMLLILILPPPPVTRTPQPPLRTLLADRALQKISGGAFVLHYAMASLFLILPATLSLPLADYWKVYAAGFAAALPPALWLIMRMDKKPQLCAPLAVALLFISAVLLPFTATLAMAVAAVIFFFAGFCALEAALPAMAARQSSVHTRSSAMGMVMTCEFAGVFCGGLTAGALITVLDGIPAVALLCCLLGGWFIAIRR